MFLCCTVPVLVRDRDTCGWTRYNVRGMSSLFKVVSITRLARMTVTIEKMSDYAVYVS